jgi:hypothetical protein
MKYEYSPIEEPDLEFGWSSASLVLEPGSRYDPIHISFRTRRLEVRWLDHCSYLHSFF